MAVPTTNVKFSDLQTEFGGVNPISLSEYYRGAGGGYVPSGTTSSYGTIPTSGQISVGVFRGTVDFVPGSNTFTSNGTFVVPNYGTITIEAWGGGGGGGEATGATAAVSGQTPAATTVTGGSVNISAGGGGGGGYANTSSSPGADGAGGTASGGLTTNTNGAAGTSAGGGTAPSGSVAGGAGGAHGVNISTGSYPGTAGSAPGGGGGGGIFEQVFKAGGLVLDSGSGGSGAYVKTVTTSAVTKGATLTITIPPAATGGSAGGAGLVIITYV
jgi:hypothetical protein